MKFVIIFLVAFTINLFSQQIYINEIMANNQNYAEDPDGPGEYDEWFELYNPDFDNSYSISGLYLSNDINNLTKWTIPDSTIISAGGFLLFTADNQEYQGKFHTNFLLSASGGELILTASDGTTIIDSVTYSAQDPDISVGRMPDGSPNWSVTPQPSPGYPNDNNDPYQDQIYSATSTDAINWTVKDSLIIDHASVPGAIYFGGKIYLYYVNFQDPQADKLSVGISNDNGKTFNFYDVNISGSSSPHPVDPNAIIDNGEIRLTYVGDIDAQTKNIVTAHSVDGINFTEDNILLSGEYFDPDLFYDTNNNKWVLLTGNASIIYKATSTTSTGSFTLDNNFSWDSGSISSTHYIENKYHTYYVDDGICVTEYKNGELTQPPIAENIVDFGERLTADPTVVNIGRGNYIMYFKTKAEQTPLPIVLSSFSAIQTSLNTCNIYWTTESENSVSGFNIFKSESDNFNNSQFLNATSIPATNTSFVHTYSFTDNNLTTGQTYYYWLQTVFYDGTSSLFGSYKITINNNDNPVPDILQTYHINIFPNPFNPTTNVRFSIPKDCFAELSVFNLKGEKIKTLAKNYYKKGNYNTIWNGKNQNNKQIASGIYLLRLITDNKLRAIEKTLLLK